MPRKRHDDERLGVDLAGIALRNPVMLAAGTAGHLDEMAGAMDLSGVGALVTKSITRKERPGNDPWRVVEAGAGMLNAIGLANAGAERFEREHAPRAAGCPAVVFGSIAGHSEAEYVEVAEMFARCAHIPAVEVNVSCPNVEGGLQFGDTAEGVGRIVRAVRPALGDKKLFVKLPPATTGAPGAGAVDLARAAVDAGADGLTVANTTPAMAIDVETLRPRLANTTGGLSGPAVHPVAVRLVRLVYEEVARPAGVPIVGVGGVMNWRDAAEFVLAGAAAVQVGTALFVDPCAPGRIARGLARWAERKGAGNISELVGAMRPAAPAS